MKWKRNWPISLAFVESKYWRHRTNKGKVVYKRKKHEFTYRDLERIWLKLGEKPRSREENREFIDQIKNLVLSIIRWLADNPETAISIGTLLSIAMILDNLVDFCSGDLNKRIDHVSGGGGSSRDF